MGTATTQAKTVKKLSLGNIAKKDEGSKTAYPVLNDSKASQLAATIIEQQAQLEALEGAVKTNKAELKMVYATPHYFAVNHGKHEVPSSISVPSDKGEVLVSFANRYSKLESDAEVRALIGDELTDTFFAQSLEIKISGDKLPSDPVRAQELVNELQTLFAKYDALPALEAKEGIKPTGDFHAARHSALSVAQNIAVDQICPIIAMVKTKGRK